MTVNLADPSRNPTDPAYRAGLAKDVRELDRYGHHDAASVVRAYLDATEPPTPVSAFDSAGWWAKREDYAGWDSPDMPSGAKVRQYRAMIESQEEGLPLVVGCAAASAMQVYLAAAAQEYGRRAIVVVPKRKVWTPSTRWAAAHGAEVIETPVGYMTTVRKRAREVAAEIGGCVRWDQRLAAIDNSRQVVNLPADTARVIVPTGSGLTAAGVVAGMHREGMEGTVVAVTVSGLANRDTIRAGAYTMFGIDIDRTGITLDVVEPATPYDRPMVGELPDGTHLDPYYAAKALPHVRPGDTLWVSGRRPAQASWE